VVIANERVIAVDLINFSVVIPTCDRLDYLLDAMNSVFEQTYVPKELNIIDNGLFAVNKNELPQIDGVQVNLIRGLPYFGVAQARNVGALLCTQEYIAFLDDDDVWDRFYLEMIMGSIHENPDSDIFIGAMSDLETRKLLVKKSGDFVDHYHFISKVLRINPGITGSNTVVRREVFFNSKGYDPYLTTGQDKALVLDLAIDGFQPKRVGGAIMFHRLNTTGFRQTELTKRLQGKYRFIVKYRKIMKISALVFNFVYFFKILLDFISRKIKNIF
jgi:glycosyltransferase involved in cell wall biosynthesis